ncbi:MAG: hypothetical protein AMXMBFR34_04420 [Myxococcaceae bacterium]
MKRAQDADLVALIYVDSYRIHPRRRARRARQGPRRDTDDFRPMPGLRLANWRK